MSNISELTAKRSKRDDVARETSKAQDHSLSSVANITSSRRQMIAGAALGLGSLAISAMPANSSTNMDGRTNMDSRLHQEVDFEVSASRIYAAGVNGSGPLCVLTFQAKAAGDSIVSVTKAAARDSKQQALPVITTGTIVHAVTGS
jgi:hypothetical protein